MSSPMHHQQGPEAPRQVRRSKGERGVALLLVMGMLVMMSSFVVEFQYNTQVRYSLAANYRDQVRARYLAESGINIYRLLIMAMYNVQRNPMGQMLVNELGVDLGMVFTQLIPQLDTGLLRFMGEGFGGDDIQLDREEGASLKEDATPKTSSSTFSGSGAINSSLSSQGGGFLDFDGDFSAFIEPEDRKININMLGKEDRLETNPAFMALYGIMNDVKYQPLFRERKITPQELIGNLRDWIDADGEVSAGQGGYEDNSYQKLDDPYSAKNARFTSLAEIHLVEGWDDTFYNLFVPYMTIYGTDKINPNNVTDDVLVGLIRAYCLGGVASSTTDEGILLALQNEEWLLVKASSQFSDGSQFATALGAAVGGDCSEIAPHLGFETRAYRLTATGIVGDAQKTIEVVVTNRARLLYWREN